MLRGSLLLEAWAGEDTREPGDLDRVVVPPTVNMDSPLTAAMFKGVIAATVAEPADGAVTFDPAGIAMDEIWTYDRVPGRRLLFTWRADDLPPGDGAARLHLQRAPARPPGGRPGPPHRRG